METSQPASRAYKEFFPSAGFQVLITNHGFVKEMCVPGEYSWVQWYRVWWWRVYWDCPDYQRWTYRDWQWQNFRLKVTRIVSFKVSMSHYKSTSGFSLQCDEFWPNEDILLQNSPQLRHPTAGRARAPKRRLPSNQMLKQKVSNKDLVDWSKQNLVQASSVLSSDEGSSDLAREKVGHTINRAYLS